MQSPFFSLIIAAHTHEITTVTIEEMHYKFCIFTCLVEKRGMMSGFFEILLNFLISLFNDNRWRYHQKS